MQMALGRAPSLDGSLADDGVNVPLVESESLDNMFGKSFEIMRSTQENFVRWAYQDRE